MNSSQIKFEEINNKILLLKKELLMLKIRQKTNQTIKPHIIKNIKQQIAQMLTLKTQYINQQ